MSSMESFYGGRQGASFVIVKRFDGIDIPNDVYRFGWYAKDKDGFFYVPLIERNVDNYADYPDWGSIPKDGVTTVVSQSGITSDPLPVEKAEGMKQCFEKGGMTTSEVGYGEYVIIDTIFGLGEYNNPDNGKVYRRGMNYDSDLGGAEYIGQIVGPQGSCPKLEMSTVEDILTHTESQSREYNMTEGDAQDGIVPGKYTNTTGDVNYNDEITYGWATVRDDHGNITGALIGFTFPYLIPEITSLKRSAYYTQEDYDEGRITDVSLIGTAIKDEDNFLLFIDNGENTEDRDPTHGDTGHAFYRRWKLSVPQGIKGDSQSQLEIVPQKIREGALLWNTEDISLDPVASADNRTYVILDDNAFGKDCVYPYDDSSAIVAVRRGSDPNRVYYAKIEDTYMLKFRYRQTSYDEHVDGSDYNIIDLGDYNTIRKIWLTDSGYLWASYNADEDSILNTEFAIQWIKDVETLSDGTIVVTYNTVDEIGRNNKKTFDKAVDWIDSVALANINNPEIFDPESTNVNSGHFRIIFNNDSVVNQTGTWRDGSGNNHAVWETDLTWPQSVSLNTEGLLKFLYNNNLYEDKSIYTDANEGSCSFTIPWITNALIDENGTFAITYNNNINGFDKLDISAVFDSTQTYYVKDKIGQFDVDSTVNATNFADKVAEGLYIVKENWDIENNTYSKVLRLIEDVNIRTGLVENSDYDFEGEGTGDQRVEITYNTESTPGIKDTTVIGAPLNYIMEAIVSKYDVNAPSTPQNHLLVLYSDPAYRQWLAENYPNKIYSYTSEKFTQADPTDPSKKIFITRNDWFDLGYVKGEPGGLHIIGQYELAAGETYRDYLDDAIPPENMPGNTPEERGWAYLIVDKSGEEDVRTIYTYDYEHSEWIVVSDLSAITVDPTQIVILDSATIDPITSKLIPENNDYANLPKENGLWFITSEMIAAY